ncbi:protein disulfide-isomerase [Leptospira kobayashii]|uniref:Protein disulfide-isomerase n=1 Tax=Leptospira kobayashii TaxID=1917830 RepID=A0ABN6KF89_9LEPT|nr:thioredoxin domain-containing protein [Leptospira kobayashii]BDA79744.1 protein disulfide-isomerase [Leptospira kobayashii]
MDTKKLSIIGVIVSAIGVILSFLLAIEYFGQGTENVGNSFCNVTGGGDSCLQVAQSSYSAIRGIPFIGDIPIALLGFGFYGTLVFLFGLNLSPKYSDTIKQRSLTILFLAALALLVDIILFGISVGLIGTVCRLCGFTYLVTIALGVISFLLIKQSGADFKELEPSVKNSIGTLFTSFLVAFSLGFATSKLSTAPSAGAMGSSRGLDSSDISKKISDYEAGEKLNIDLSGSPSIGKKDAPITIVKYADFNCGHCLHTSHILRTVLGEYDGMVRVVYRNFPLDGSCNRFVGEPRPGASSCVAAIASICADKQGKFDAMYTGLYDNTEKGVGHTTSTILNLANTLSLNVNQLKTCMSSKEAADQLNKEIEEAGRLKIQATPSLYINDKRIDSGTPDPKFLKALLDRLIQKI